MKSEKINLNERPDKTVVHMLLNVFPAQFFLYVLNALLNTVNGIVISGTQSVQALSAMALCSPVTMFRTVLSTTISTGMVILCGHKVGSGNSNDIKKVMSTAFDMSIIIGLIATASLLIFRIPVARFLGANNEILEDTVDYLTGLALGVLPAILISLFINIIQMNKKSYGVILFGAIRLVLVIASVSIVAYLCKGNLFQISVASSVASLINVIFIYIYIKRDSAIFGKFAVDIDFSFAREIVFMGVPAAAVSLMTGFRDIYLNNTIIAYGGAKAAAAMGILTTICFLIDGVTYGTGFATGMLASVSYGERDAYTMRYIFKDTVKFGTALTAILAVFYSALARPIVSLLATDPEVIEYAVSLIRIYAVGRIAVVLLMIFINIYQSCKKTVAVFVCNLLAFLLFPIAFSLLFKDIIGVDAMWWAYTIGPAVMLLVLPVMCLIINRKAPVSLPDLLLLGDIKDGYRINRLLTSKKEAVNISAGLVPILHEKGLSIRECNIYALCLEETAVNIFDNAFSEDNLQKQYVDVQIYISENATVMRFRDNAPKYDLISQAKIYNSDPDDMIKNIGYRIISGYAEEMSYSRIYDANILRIEL